MDFNMWAHEFMTKIRGFVGDEKFVFIFDNLNDRLGVGCKDANSFLIEVMMEITIMNLSKLLIACGKAAPIKNGPGLSYFP